MITVFGFTFCILLHCRSAHFAYLLTNTSFLFFSITINQGILETVNGAFGDCGIPRWKDKVVGMGADGASVNLRKKGGVSALLRQHSPHLFDFHCLPHRLELALVEVQRSCHQVEVVYDVLQLIWKTYHYSPKSTRELKALASELGVDVLKPTQVSGTRWLPHISRALNILIKPVGDGSGQYAALLCHMDHLSVASKNTDIKGRAKFISEKMRSISFTAFCHFLADMFGIISKLSLKMQRNDLILPVAVSLLHETVTNVQVLKSRPSPNGHLQRFMNILEKSNGEMQFQGITLKGTLDGTPKRGGARPDNFQSSVTEAVDLCQWYQGEVWFDAYLNLQCPTFDPQYHPSCQRYACFQYGLLAHKLGRSGRFWKRRDRSPHQLVCSCIAIGWLRS